MTNYSYPHVNITTYAKPHRIVTSDIEDNTVLFVPFMSELGPSNEIRRIFSLSEFQSVYGALDYSKQGQTALNIANWLTYEGTVYAYRLFNEDGGDRASANITTNIYKEDPSGEIYIKAKDTGGETFYIGFDSEKKKTSNLDNVVYFVETDNEEKAAFQDGTSTDKKVSKVNSSIKAKYFGKRYNDLKISLSYFNNKSISLVVFLDEKRVESQQRIEFGKLNSFSDSSSYIGEIEISEELFFYITSEDKPELTFSFNEASDDLRTFNEAVSDFFKNDASSVISNRLETPINLILDAGFSKETKKSMADLAGEEGRDDINIILDSFTAKTDSSGMFTGKSPDEATLDEIGYNSDGNLAIYSQCYLIEEGTFAGKDIWVTPTYFLSSLIPNNDLLYGIQFPTAGLTRGKLTGIKSINENPGPSAKQNYFSDRINYTEKDSRGYYFMSQRTYDRSETEGVETALSFLNNSRVKNKIVQDLEKIGREYLFEFNDATTLSNMSTALNRYVSQWVQNRTLSYGNVTVSASEYSNETVDVSLSIRFTGTIEIINIDIRIE